MGVSSSSFGRGANSSIATGINGAREKEDGGYFHPFSAAQSEKEEGREKREGNATLLSWKRKGGLRNLYVELGEKKGLF